MTRFILTFIAVYLCSLLYLYVSQRKFIFVPDTTPVTAMAGMQEFDVTTADGLALKGWYVPPEKGKPVLVMFHGNGGTVLYRAFKTPIFTVFGYGVLMAEYRGYGGNPGKPTEQGFYEDARAFIRALNLPEDRIILHGESLGTAVAVQMATEFPGVKAVILEAPITSMAANVQFHVPYAPVFFLLRDRFDSLSKIGRVKAPVLILHGAADLVVPYKFGKRLFDAAPGPKTLETFPVGGHMDLYNFGAAPRTLKFLEHLDQPAKLLHNTPQGE